MSSPIKSSEHRVALNTQLQCNNNQSSAISTVDADQNDLLKIITNVTNNADDARLILTTELEEKIANRYKKVTEISQQINLERLNPHETTMLLNFEASLNSLENEISELEKRLEGASEILKMEQKTKSSVHSILLEVETPIGKFIAYRPNLEDMQRTSRAAKNIFVEAFSSTYREYHQNSKAALPIEKWLRLKEGLTLETWLSNTFDGEYEEYLKGAKEFIFLCTKEGQLVGWLSHSMLSKDGELYLSQCSLEHASRNQKVASTVFHEVFKDHHIKNIFPGITEIKLITRKINTIARSLYIKARFHEDEQLDPRVYGESYDDRYIGYRLDLRTENK